MEYFERTFPDDDPEETEEWLESLDALIQTRGQARARYIVGRLLARAQQDRLDLPSLIQTPYVNTIPPAREPDYPGDEHVERLIRRLVRWNAVAMVVRANERDPGIGGHLSTYASAATLYEVGFHHFFRGKDGGQTGDQIFFQGHAAPGIYARAFVEGRIGREQMERFRQEVERGRGLSSYPHPWLMSEFWEFPTVSMGLGPIAAIYQARFNRYLEARGLIDADQSHVWCFLGDGESDEPESLGSLSIAARERLDNLTFIVNCNLQRLDGPVRGNGKIIQELEAVFHGAGWNVLKVIWGREWDPLLESDNDGVLVQRMDGAIDGDYQKYSVSDGGYTREHFFGTDPRLQNLVRHLSDEDIRRLRRGGHDARKVYAAYQTALETRGRPTAILAKTVKGWTLGEGAEGRNVAHQAKKLSLEELRVFRDLLELPISDKALPEAPFYRPDDNHTILEYLRERRHALGGSVPRRKVRASRLEAPPIEYFGELLEGTPPEREVSTTMAFVRMLNLLLKHDELGRLIVPIVPDEARTFGMEALFRQIGIYSSAGQRYEPVDKGTFLYYRESQDGQILEEGITEAGSMASFTAAGTAYSTHGVNCIPFYIFYSMFGFQRTGDQIWAFGDIRGRGFLLGATAGRTTLNGEGLQHQDGHSHLLASTVPNVVAYDPAFAYEVAVIVQDGIRRMYAEGDDVFYYLTLQNEPYSMPAMPEGAREGVLRGLYKFRPAPGGGRRRKGRARAQILGSGSILLQALRAQEILAERFSVDADVWSAPGYLQVRREALEVERWNMWHPDRKPRRPWVSTQFSEKDGPVVAVSDYMRAVPDQIARWIPGGLFSLGTDGFGRSDSRAALRRHFEIDAETVAAAVLGQLARRGELEPAAAAAAIRELGLDPDKVDPATA